MRTHPIVRDDGSLRGFEITSSWIVMHPLLKILRSVPGVSGVRRTWLDDDRVKFNFLGVPAVVNEPWGDNSRYWVGLEQPDAFIEIDISPIHEAFKAYRGFPAVTFWPFGDEA